MDTQQILQATNQYLMSNYGRLPIATAEAHGSVVRSADGKEYIDFFAGFGCGGIGHCHPKVVEAVQAQAARMMCVGNLFTWESQVELARRINEHGFEGKAFYCHSGAEANEAALKLARLAAGEGRYKIISFTRCFHGRTMGALSLTPPKFQAGFEPMLPGGLQVPFGDIEAVKAAIDDETAGIIIEPIQGEGGVNVPVAEFMQALRALCDEHNLALICDEVWTAPGRTGQWFAYQHYGVTPDVMTLGKAIGGGVPVGVCWAGGRYADTLTPGTHGCTLGGNPVCAAAGLAVMDAIAEEGLIDQAVAKGERIVDAIESASPARVKQIRGKGLMLGIELDGPAKDVFTTCLDNGLMINVTYDTTVRLAPPMNIPADLLDKGLDILINAING